jgi:hypothetical protein
MTTAMTDEIDGSQLEAHIFIPLPLGSGATIVSIDWIALVLYKEPGCK